MYTKKKKTFVYNFIDYGKVLVILKHRSFTDWILDQRYFGNFCVQHFN